MKEQPAQTRPHSQWRALALVLLSSLLACCLIFDGGVDQTAGRLMVLRVRVSTGDDGSSRSPRVTVTALRDSSSSAGAHGQDAQQPAAAAVEQDAADDEAEEEARVQQQRQQQRQQGGVAATQPSGTKAQQQQPQQQEAKQPAAKQQQQQQQQRQQGALVSKSAAAKPARGGDGSAYVRAAAACRDLPCLTAAGTTQPLGPGQFRFPHFFIVGFQKCATTALFGNLINHPQVLSALIKEPEFFSEECGYSPAACSPQAQEDYMLKTMKLQEWAAAGGRLAASEASTHYGRSGAVLAKPLAETFPWLRVVISLREPIGRALSMQAHMADKHGEGCLTSSTHVAECILAELQDAGGNNYTTPLEAWLAAYPREQLYLTQYERLTASGETEGLVADVKRFLGLDPDQGRPHLTNVNTREQHLMAKGELEKGQKASGWRMQRAEYERLVQLVRPDAERVAQLAERHGLFPSAKEWMASWEAIWEATLAGCDGATGECDVGTKAG